MGVVAYDLQQQAAHNIEIIVHIDDTLEEHRRKELVARSEPSAAAMRLGT